MLKSYLVKCKIDPLSIYKIDFVYTSKQEITLEALLLSQGRQLISKSSKTASLPIGRNSASILIPTDGFIPSMDRCIILINPLNINIGGGLTAALANPDAVNNIFTIEEVSVKIQKIFDIRSYLEKSNFSGIGNNAQSAVIRHTPGIILSGYYLREDGLGAHLPNLVENVFYNYKNLSFIRMPNRSQLNFYFLNNISNWSKKNLERHNKDFKWMKFWYSNLNKHLAIPQLYTNGKYFHVGGIDINPSDFRREIEIVQFLKKVLNVETYYYLMWESTGIEIMRDLLLSFDNIIVTNNWIKMLIQEKLGHPKVHVVEHIAKFYSEKNLAKNDTKFNFGYSGGLWERKNVDKIIIAFQQFKTDSSKCTLRIHSRNFVNTQQMIDKIKNIAKNDPSIEIKNETLPDKQYTDWWETLNCLVFVSAGEGYSIQPRQALSMGIPVILSKNTSHLDLIDVPGIIWVPSSKQEKAHFSGMPGANIDVGFQFAVKIEDIKIAMEECYKNYAFYKKEAEKAIPIIKEKTNPNIIKEQWEQILKI